MVESVLSDGAALVGPVRMPAYLADSNEVPILIGMAGLIERGLLHADMSSGECSFEFHP